MRYALKVYYDGGAFYGSQIQPDKRTVEGELLKALKKFELEVGNFQGAARTDRGVSALGNVYAFDADRPPIPRALNSFLPWDVRVLAWAEVEEDFNPRRMAVEKVYKYFLLDRDYDLDAMRKAAELFKGVHSFHNYCRDEGRDPVRQLRTVRLERQGDVIVLTFIGKSFLWEMVRRLVTALRLVGEGRLAGEEIQRSLIEKSGTKLPPSPPEYLLLWRVVYDFRFEWEEYSARRLSEELLKRLERRKLACFMDETIRRELETRL